MGGKKMDYRYIESNILFLFVILCITISELIFMRIGGITFCKKTQERLSVPKGSFLLKILPLKKQNNSKQKNIMLIDAIPYFINLVLFVICVPLVITNLIVRFIPLKIIDVFTLVKSLSYMAYLLTIRILGEIDLNNSFNNSENVVKIKNINNDKIMMIDKNSQKIRDELIKAYGRKIGLEIYALSLLRVNDFRVHDFFIQGIYEESLLNNVYSKISLKRGEVIKILRKLGKDHYIGNSISFFNSSHINESGHQLLFFDLVANNNLMINHFFGLQSNYVLSYKIAKQITACFDYDEDQLLFYMIDEDGIVSSCTKGLTKRLLNSNSIMLLDFEISYDKILEIINSGIYFLSPIKDGFNTFSKCKMNENIDRLNIDDRNIVLRKGYNDTDSLYYYFITNDISFNKNSEMIIDIEYNVIEEVKKRKKINELILVSNINLGLIDIYKVYKKRWAISQLFSKYINSNIIMENGKKDNNYINRGSVFVDYISTIIENTIRDIINT